MEKHLEYMFITTVSLLYAYNRLRFLNINRISLINVKIIYQYRKHVIVHLFI